MKKFKIPPIEAQELMNLYRKITGKRLIDQPNPEMVLEHTHNAVQEYLKKKMSHETPKVFV